MKKNLRMAAGIVLHPVRVLLRKFYREVDNDILRVHAERSWNYKNWNRMHEMSALTGTAYTTSELLGRIGCFAGPPKGYE